MHANDSLCGLKQEPEGVSHGMLEEEFNDSWLVARSWDDAFLGALGPLPQTLHSPCCSEFVVSRERIQARPKAFYIHVRCCSALTVALMTLAVIWHAVSGF